MNYNLFLQAFLEKYQGIKDNQRLFQYLREELQYLVLHALYTKMRYPIFFMWGTKLRLSYGINRFSEDIDLALDKADPHFPAEQFLLDIQNNFAEKVTGFRLQAKGNSKRNVVKVMLSFQKILFDIGCSPLPSQILKIKVELDTNPPSHAMYEKKTYRSLAGDFIVHTHDLGTGFAGKLAAILLREYQKGRDYYDLQWYLQYQPRINMNIDYLNANMIQQGKSAFKNKRTIAAAVSKKIKELDIPRMRQDLEALIGMDTTSFQLWLENYIPETLALLAAYEKQR